MHGGNSFRCALKQARRVSTRSGTSSDLQAMALSQKPPAATFPDLSTTSSPRVTPPPLSAAYHRSPSFASGRSSPRPVTAGATARSSAANSCIAATEPSERKRERHWGGLKAPSPPRWIACLFARPRAARKGSSVSRLLKAYSLHLPPGRCRTRVKGQAREGPLLGSAHDKSSGHSSPSGDRTTHVELPSVMGNR